MVRGLIQRMRLSELPALSFVPEARAPPNGCWPTTAPVRLVVDIEVPRGMAELLIRQIDRFPVGRKHRAGERIRGGRVAEIERLLVLPVGVDIDREHRAEELGFPSCRNAGRARG